MAETYYTTNNFVGFKVDVNWLSKLGRVDTATVWEILDWQSEALSEGELVSINEEGGFDEKDGDIPEEVILAWLHM